MMKCGVTSGSAFSGVNTACYTDSTKLPITSEAETKSPFQCGAAVCVCVRVCICAYVGGEPVWWCGLVDVVVVVVTVRTALRGLSLPPTNRAALHHAAARLCRGLLRGQVGVTVFCYHSVRRQDVRAGRVINKSQTQTALYLLTI